MGEGPRTALHCMQKQFDKLGDRKTNSRTEYDNRRLKTICYAKWMRRSYAFRDRAVGPPGRVRVHLR